MLVAIDAVGIRVGGGKTLLRQFLVSLPAARPQWDWQVFLLPRAARQFDDPPAGERVQIKHVSLGNSQLGRLLWLQATLPRMLRASSATVLFSFANVALRRPVVPQVVYIHQPLAFESATARNIGILDTIKLRGLRRLIVRGASSSRFVIVQTPDMQRRLANLDPDLAEKIRVVPGCFPSIQTDGEVRPQKQKLIDSCGCPRLLYVAHGFPHKNHATLIRALPRIAQRYPNVTLLLTIEAANGGLNPETGYISRLHRLVTELGMNYHVAWLGTLSEKEARYAMQQSSVAVFPSLDESFGSRSLRL